MMVNQNELIVTDAFLHNLFCLAKHSGLKCLLSLQFSQFTQDLSSWVLHFQQLQDGCSIVGDGHILYFSRCSRSRDLSGSQECTGVHGRLWEWAGLRF
ncbi:hypothetical protein EYF80_025327 [Liparis tanakae]|uniref:Uncharacterized protein n=1 Tax=Liparis tanakae TaxID=230148 RepID=A0A4Z2HFI6_9TELE|nr:hypothetical protein EYF80_025327 [Liparis tanakae]